MRRKRRRLHREEGRGCRRSRFQESWPNLKEAWGGEGGKTVLHARARQKAIPVNGSAEFVGFLWFQEHVGVILSIWMEQV